MKVFDLFEDNASGAYHKPSFRPGARAGVRVKGHLGRIRGSVDDWLDAIGATHEDVNVAYEKVKKTPEYKAILSLGLEDKSSEREQKNGTLNFIGYLDEIKSYYDRNPRARITFDKTRLRYKVLANGKIDVVHDNDFNRSDRAVPKPRLIAGKPVESIVKMMTQSLEHLYGMLSKRIEKSKKKAA